MKRWLFAIIIGFSGLLAIFFRYDVTLLNTSSGPVAYIVDRWTGKAWYLRGNIKTPVGAPPPPQENRVSASIKDNREKYVKPTALKVISNENLMSKVLGRKFLLDWLSEEDIARVIAYSLYWKAITPDDLTPEGLNLLSEYNFDTSGHLKLNEKFPWEAEKMREWEAILTGR